MLCLDLFIGAMQKITLEQHHLMMSRCGFFTGTHKELHKTEIFKEKKECLSDGIWVKVRGWLA